MSAHELTLKKAGGGGARAEAKTKRLDCSVEDYMLKLKQENKAGSTAVLLIDMQGDLDAMRRKGACARYNEDEVYVNQASVLEAADEYDLYVFEIRIVRTSGPALTDIPTLGYLSNRLPITDKLVSVEKPSFNSFEDTSLAAELDSKHVKTAIVMGHQANTCVLNTIFGTPSSIRFEAGGKQAQSGYIPGLLDRKITVVTSRVIFASDNAELDPSYHMIC